MSVRPLIILQPNGRELYPDASRALMRGEPNPDLGPPVVIDLSDIPNADAQSPFMVEVQEQCDHGSWHAVSRMSLECWDDKR